MLEDNARRIHFKKQFFEKYRTLLSKDEVEVMELQNICNTLPTHITGNVTSMHYEDHRNLNIHYAHMLVIVVISAKWILSDDLICEITS